MSAAVAGVAVVALEFAAMVTFVVLSIVAYAKYTGTDPQTNANKFNEVCGPGSYCRDGLRGLQAGGKRRIRKTRRRHK